MPESAWRSAGVALRVEGIRARLLRLEEVISELAGFARMDPDALLGNLRDRWAAERGLQLGAEILFDIGNHILSAKFGISPESHEDIFDELTRRGVLDAGLRSRLKGLGGFRNILVHDYLRIDPDLLRDGIAQAPRDFGDFAAAIHRWLDSQDA
jgi:uncharacterized protein YutE (UPF0331/DUF86 family)